jgi:hypothetical protein
MFLKDEIEDCLRRQEEAELYLQQAVVTFRAALGRDESSTLLLGLAHEVHYALEGLRSVRSALRHLRAAREEFIAAIGEAPEAHASRPTPQATHASAASVRSA